VSSVLQDPAVHQQLVAQGLEANTLEPAQLQGFVDAEVRKWTDVVKKSNAQVD